MDDRERDPVAYAQCQDAGRVGGVAAANDREDDSLAEYLATLHPSKRGELQRAMHEREHGPW